MLVLFGYMDLLIIIKWLQPWTGNESTAPAIIGTMIGMFLKFGEIPEGSTPLIQSAEYQQWVSNMLLLTGLICVPTMLFVKPLWWLCNQSSDGHAEKNAHHALLQESSDEIEMGEVSHKNATVQVDEEEHKDDDKEKYKDLDKGEVKHKDDKKRGDKQKHEEGNADKHKLKPDLQAKLKQPLNESQMLDDLTTYVQGGPQETHDFSEVFIHQLIETIEFVLGTVSNTASYLRLWALSLAHSQLAAVFFEKLLGSIALEADEGKGSSIMLFLLFPPFFTMTVFVLMCMDSMECFLH